jgi:hypothetical protein
MAFVMVSIAVMMTAASIAALSIVRVSRTATPSLKPLLLAAFSFRFPPN